VAFQVWSGGHRSGNLDLCDVKTIISSISRGILNAVTKKDADQKSLDGDDWIILRAAGTSKSSPSGK